MTYIFRRTARDGRIHCNLKLFFLSITDKSIIDRRTSGNMRRIGLVPMLYDLYNEDKTDYRTLGAMIDKWVCSCSDLGENFSLETIATETGNKLEDIFRYFNSYLRQDFRKWRSHTRLEKAKELMKNDDMLNLDEIAAATGFKHTSSFHRLFKAYTGMTPSKWRDR